MPESFLSTVAAVAVVAAIFFRWKLLKSRKLWATLEGQLSLERRRVVELQEQIADKDKSAERNRQNSIRNPENQLAAVMDPDVDFNSRPVMNAGEVRVFYAAQKALKKKNLTGWHVFPQVSLGEVIDTHSYKTWLGDRAHQSINSKRCDILIADNKGRPWLVVEYQGGGHYQGNAAQRDEIKRIAVTRSRIKYLEIPDGASDDYIVSKIISAF
jgi:hypothetical protein